MSTEAVGKTADEKTEKASDETPVSEAKPVKTAKIEQQAETEDKPKKEEEQVTSVSETKETDKAHK